MAKPFALFAMLFAAPLTLSACQSEDPPALTAEERLAAAEVQLIESRARWGDNVLSANLVDIGGGQFRGLATIRNTETNTTRESECTVVLPGEAGPSSVACVDTGTTLFLEPQPDQPGADPDE